MTPTLAQLAEQHGTDKFEHGYCPFYERFLKPLRYQAMVLVEIGVGGFKEANTGGASLKMWRDWMPKAQVVGIDSEDKSFLHDPENRIHIYRSNQASPQLWEHILGKFGQPEVIIDDGSHQNQEVRDTFFSAFPILNDGGLYFVEDTQASYWEQFGGQRPPDRAAANTVDLSQEPEMLPIGGCDWMMKPRPRFSTMNFFKHLVDGLNHMEFDLPGYQPTYFDQNILEMTFRHNLIVLKKGLNNHPSNLVQANRLVLPGG